MSNHKSINETARTDTNDHRPGRGIVPVDHTRLLHKIDLYVLPFVCIMYLLAFLDRVNISNASVFGLAADLHLTGLQYNNCLVIFFVPYILFEIPSNFLLRRLKPHVWLSLCMFCFGFTTIMQGFVKSYSGLLATRFFLGLFEAGMFPGSFYLLSMWYRREESQKRYTFFFSSTTLAGAFGGLLATGIGHMDHIQGKRAWQWVFILEGVVTAVLAIAWYFLLPDFPENAKFLDHDEHLAVRSRLVEDVGSSGLEASYTWPQILGVFRDYKIFLGGCMYLGLIVCAYSYAFFNPTIIKGLGYGTIETQLYSVPPYAAAFVVSMVVAYLSDRTRHRFTFGAVSCLVAITGFAILLSYPSSVHLKYASLFLASVGIYTAMPIFICWYNMNLAGHLRRGVGSAFQIGFGNIGGIIASYTFPAGDGPRYVMGYSICIAFVSFALASALAYFIACTVQNRAKASLGREGAVDQNITEKDMLGDLNVGYRYLR